MAKRDPLELRVQQQTAELRQTNERLRAEIAERKLAEGGLIRAQAEEGLFRSVGLRCELLAFAVGIPVLLVEHEL
jgi:hypothetical protein